MQRNCRTLSSHCGRQKLSAASTLTTYPKALKIVNQKRFYHAKFSTAEKVDRHCTSAEQIQSLSRPVFKWLAKWASSEQKRSRKNRIHKALLPTHWEDVGRWSFSRDFRSRGRCQTTCLAVANPNKPGKVRLVLDATAKSDQKSLKDFFWKTETC